ncbi:hypothetical protein [Paenibacillus sp. MBLB4367]|uniref:hypothetical protein n=1 Tax=Paenibacillus sp. MBLB4367 TaxID=3384767 RepID=UPI003907E88A
MWKIVEFLYLRLTCRYVFGQKLTQDTHFRDHVQHEIPVQVYDGRQHIDIGMVESYSEHFIKINNTAYNRNMYTYISRPGY